MWAIANTNHERRILRKQEAERAEERRQREASERRLQAESVAAVVHIEPEPVPDPHSRVQRSMNTKGMYAGLKDEYTRYRYSGWVDIHNESRMPIYNVRVPVEQDEDGRVLIRSQDVVAPGQVGHIHLTWRDDPSEHGQGLDVAFRDAAGVAWHRHANGDLHEGDPWPDPDAPDDEDQA